MLISACSHSKVRSRSLLFLDLPFLNTESCPPDAWSLHRVELLHILLRRVPETSTHLGKKLQQYVQGQDTEPITLAFADGTSATCDVLIGCDGIRSVTRAQMMQHEAEMTGMDECMQYIEPRWSGTVAYRVLVPSARVIAKNPNHSALSGGQFVSSMDLQPIASSLNAFLS